MPPFVPIAPAIFHGFPRDLFRFSPFSVAVAAAAPAADFHFLTTIKRAHKSKPQQQQQRNGATDVKITATK